jgi:hypothetical protein
MNRPLVGKCLKWKMSTYDFNFVTFSRTGWRKEKEENRDRSSMEECVE